MMLLTAADVTLRYLGHPIPGAVEISGFLLALVLALPLARTHIVRRHISIEFIASRAPLRMRLVLQGIFSALSCGIFGLIAWQLAVRATKLQSLGRVSETLTMPFFPFVYVAAFAFAMMCLAVLIDLAKVIFGK
jgi:TRAP-type C4-dicarboxylate transport system permease small subunit